MNKIDIENSVQDTQYIVKKPKFYLNFFISSIIVVLGFFILWLGVHYDKIHDDPASFYSTGIFQYIVFFIIALIIKEWIVTTISGLILLYLNFSFVDSFAGFFSKPQSDYGLDILFYLGGAFLLIPLMGIVGAIIRYFKARKIKKEPFQTNLTTEYGHQPRFSLGSSIFISIMSGIILSRFYNMVVEHSSKGFWIAHPSLFLFLSVIISLISSILFFIMPLLLYLHFRKKDKNLLRNA